VGRRGEAHAHIGYKKKVIAHQPENAILCLVWVKREKISWFNGGW